MSYWLFTISGTCMQCASAKHKLKTKGIAYEEINIMTTRENAILAQDLNIRTAGTLVDSETKQVIDIDTL